MKAQGEDLGNYTVFKRSAIKPGIVVDFVIFGFGYGNSKNKSWDQNKPECMKEERRILYSFFNHADPWRDQADFIIKECLSVDTHAFAVDWEEGTHHFRTDLDKAQQAKHCKMILERVRDGIKNERVGIYANGCDYSWLAHYEDVTDFFLWAADPDKNPDDHPWSDIWWRRSGRPKYDYVFDQWNWKAYAPDHGAVNNKKSMDLTQCKYNLVWLDNWLGLEGALDPPSTTNTKTLDIPFVSQLGEGANEKNNDCGPACGCSLAIAKYPDSAITPNEFYKMTGEPGDGYISFQQLQHVLKNQFEISTKRVTNPDIKKGIDAGLGIIALVKYGHIQNWEPNPNSNFRDMHFVVVSGYKPGHLYILDPLFGGRWIPNAVFNNAWAGGSPANGSIITEIPIVKITEPPLSGDWNLALDAGIKELEGLKHGSR